MPMDLLGAHRSLTRFKPTQSDLAMGRGAWRQHPRYRGCVGHWLLGEGGGLTAYDVSGYGQHGTLIDFVPSDWRTGAMGAEPLLDGVTNFIAVPSAPQYDLSGDFTFSARARIDISSGDDTLIAKMTPEDDAQFYWSIISGGDLYFYWLDGVPEEHSFAVPSYDDGIEYLYGLTLRGTSLQAYRNGLPLGAPQTKTSTLLANDADITIGGHRADLVFPPLTGVVHDVRLCNVGLSAGEMLSLQTATFLEFVPQHWVGKAATVAGPTLSQWMQAVQAHATSAEFVGVQYA